MPYYVNALDWHGLSETARLGLRRMLHDQCLPKDDNQIVPRLNLHSGRREAPSFLLTPPIVETLCLAVRAGLEAIPIYYRTSGRKEIHEVCFIAAYDPGEPDGSHRKDDE